MKTIDIKGKKYVMVNERIKYFRENYKNWGIETDIIEIKDDRVIIKTIIKDSEGIIKSTGLAYEKEGNTFINKTSFIENCETSSIGRALGLLGIGIDGSIASAEEVMNAINQQALTPIQIAKADADGCSSIEKLEAVWNENVGLQNNTEFKNHIKNLKTKFK